MSHRAGLPTVPLDEFYRDHDDPSLPHRFGIVDWDDPASWNAGAAEALVALAHDGVAEACLLDPPLPPHRHRDAACRGRRAADRRGIFAAQLIAPLRQMGLLADAIVLQRPTPVVFTLRLFRDLREAASPR